LDYSGYLGDIVASWILVPCRRRSDPHRFGDRFSPGRNKARYRSRSIAMKPSEKDSCDRPSTHVDFPGTQKFFKLDGAWIVGSRNYRPKICLAEHGQGAESRRDDVEPSGY
jgi:hypothetical protein